MKKNLFSIPEKPTKEELFEILHSSKDIKIEKIVSFGHVTPGGEWYDQEKDEWVILIQGEATLQFEDTVVMELSPGDFLFIPAHQRHRVTKTSLTPPCIWLAIHGNLTEE